MHDLRSHFFGQAEWYDGLQVPGDNEVSAWRVAKWQEKAWWIDLLNAALHFARRNGLAQTYRQRFAGVRSADLLEARARAERRTVPFPIWEIANELVVAAYLADVLGWRLVEHEPLGSGMRRGDWLFETPSGQEVFVEVKSLTEPMWQPTTGAFSRGDYGPRLRQVLSRAYRQLPSRDCATFVALVGDWPLECSHGILHSDLFAAMYGKYEIRLQVMTEDPQITYAGPSFREMLVHGGKHRRLGAVGGLIIRGLDDPGMSFYTIDNPFADTGRRLREGDLIEMTRFIVVDWRGEELSGVDPATAWGRMRAGASGGKV